MSNLVEAARKALEAMQGTSGGTLAWHLQLEAAITAMRQALEAEAEQQNEPVYWESRWLDTHPQTVTSGQWSAWERVEAISALSTVNDRVAEFQHYIDAGYNYELRALYTRPQSATPSRVYECAKRLVEQADFRLAGLLSANSKARDIPSSACSQVKARHLASLRDALAADPQPQAKWVGLTDDERSTIESDVLMRRGDYPEVLKAIEAALREKNEFK